ncbi:helix-turn-helix domain-containing protein, partial [Streptomyces sp. DH37]|uniref:helix-turn-helix domain-containing protein n=1 Tax=Streptomyces sp. DH37 TaxID=3040122 RepID=UPI0024425AD0
MAEHQIGRRAIEAGPTGKTVATNIARLRKVRGLTTRQLSGELERNGRYIPASGITRMEKGDRQVTADDLVALAAVF